MNKPLACLTLGVLVFLALGLTTASAETWTKTYGHGRDTMGHGVLLLADGGFSVVAESQTGNQEAGLRALLMKLDPEGVVVWERTYGGDRASAGTKILATDDGGFVIAGTIQSDDGDDADVLLLCVDADGNELWSKTYGTPLFEYGGALVRTADGGYIVTGNSVDPDDFVADPGAAGYDGFAGRSNVYILRTDALGNEIWSRRCTTSDNVIASGAAATSDGGVVILTYVLRFPILDTDIHLRKLDAVGNELWSKAWADGDASGYDLIATRNGGFVVSGVIAGHGDPARGKGDALLIKADADGNELWSRTYGLPDMIETAHEVMETSTGNLICVGWQERSYNIYGDDIYIASFDAGGTPLWERITASTSHNLHEGLVECSDGTLLIAGSAARPGQPFRIQLIKLEAPQ